VLQQDQFPAAAEIGHGGLKRRTGDAPVTFRLDSEAATLHESLHAQR
jgi:hypothetical protein